MEEVITYKCPNCASNLEFNPEGQNWVCQYCGSSYNEERLQELCEISKKEFIDDVNCYYCDGCGANVVSQDVLSTTCVYCGSNLILNKEMRNTLKPEKIIPFKISKKKAEKIFYKHLGKENGFVNIIGMYVPYWLYSFASDVYVENFNYDYKYITRFSDIPVDASVNINDDLAYKVGPFDYSELKDFSHIYLSGFYSERFTDKTYESYEKVSKRITEDIPYILEEVYGKDVNKNEYKIVNRMHENQYVLLPVWIINCEDRGRKYNCYINAQTGKCVSELDVLTRESTEKQKSNVFNIKSFDFSKIENFCRILVVILLLASIFKMDAGVKIFADTVILLSLVGLIISLGFITIILPFLDWSFIPLPKVDYEYYKKKTIKRSEYIVDVGRAKK